MFLKNSYLIFFFSIKKLDFYMIGVPKVSFPRSNYDVALLSKFDLVATVHIISDIPLTTVIKWQRNEEDIDITDIRYNGTTEDLVAPKLVINGVDFVNDHQVYYRCVATNSEGSWTASARIYVYDSTCLKFYKISIFMFLKFF